MSKKLSDNIAKLTGAIEKNIEVSKKGTTSPSNEGANPNEVFLTAICGSLAGMIYGETNGDADKLLQCLGKKPMLFDEIAKLSPEKLSKDIESFAIKTEVQLKDVATNVELSYAHMYNAADILGNTISTSDEFIGGILVDGSNSITDSINVLNNDINEVIGDILLEGFTNIDSIITGNVSSTMDNTLSGITEIVSCLGPKGAIAAAIIEAVFSLAKMLKLESFEEYFAQVQKTLESIFGVIGPLVDAILKADMQKITPILTAITAILAPIGKIIERLSEPMEKIQSQISEIVDSFNNLIATSVTEIIDVLLNVITPILEPISLCLTEINEVIHSLTDKVSSISDSAEAAANIAISVDGSEDMTTLIDSIKGLTGEHIENIMNLTSVLEALSMVDLSNMDKVEKNTEKLETVVGNVNKVDKKEVTKASDLLAGISAIVLTSGAVLLIGSLMMEIIDPKNLLKFSVVLLTFVSSLLVVAAIISKFIGEGIQYIGAFSNFVFTCGIILLIGSLISQWIDIKDMLKFTFMMALFVFGVTLPFKWFTKEGADAIHAGREFSFFLTRVAIIMFLGALLADVIEFKQVLKFGLMLSTFVILTSLPFIIYSRLAKDTSIAANEFALVLITASVIMFLGSLLIDLVSMEKILKFTLALMVFILGTSMPFLIFSFFGKQVDKAMKEFKWLVIVATAIMFIGALCVDLVGMDKILKFTLALMVFIMGTLLPFIIFGKTLALVVKAALQFCLVVTICSVIMFVGAYLMNIISFEDILIFTAALAVFIFGTALVFTLFAASAALVTSAALDAIIVIGIAAAIMLIGGLVIQFIDLVNLFIFAVALDLFMAMTAGAFILLSKSFKNAMTGAKQFGILLGIAALTMIAGSFLIDYIDIGNLVLFTGILSAFMFALCYAYRIATKDIKKNFTTAKQFGILVAISAATLLAGGFLFTKFPELIWGVPLFGVLLTGFLFAMAFVLKMLNKMKKDIIIGAVAMAILSGVCVVMVGIFFAIGELMARYPLSDLIIGCGLMALVVIGLALVAMGLGALLMGPQAAAFLIGVAAMAGLALLTPVLFIIMGGLALITNTFDPKNILKGLPGIAKVIVGTALIAVGLGLLLIPMGLFFLVGVAGIATLALMCIPLGMVMFLIGTISNKYDNKKMLKAVGVIAAIILAFAGIATALGAILMIPFVGKAFRKGLAVLPMLAGVALATGVALLCIGQAMKIMNSIGKFDAKPIIEALTQVMALAPALAPFNWKMAWKVQCARAVIQPMSEMISDLAQAVQDYAELKIPIYDGTEIVGYRQLKKKDFKGAGENVALIMTTLIDAIEQCYHNREDLFDGGWFSDAPAVKVINVVKKLGPAISSIVDAVKDYANLFVPCEWDDEGNPVAYKQLKNKDFKNAANNIKYIMTTLIDGVEQCYDDQPDLYQGTGFLGFGKTKAAKVLETLNNLGDTVGKITDAVIKIATGLVPMDWDDEGNPVDFKQLKPKDYMDAANTISQILYTMVEGLDRTYWINPSLFKGGGWFGWGDCKAKKVMESITGLGDVVGGIANGVLGMATAMIPDQWTEDGKPKHFIRLTGGDFMAAAQTIADIMYVSIRGVETAYYSISGGPEEIRNKIACFMELGPLIGSVAEGVAKYASMQIPIDWNKETGEPIKYQKIGETEINAAIGTIETVLTTTATAVYNANETLSKLGSNDDIAAVIKNMQSLGKVIGEAGKNVGNFAALLVPENNNPDGSVKSWKKLKPEDFDNAKENIVKVMNCMHAALDEVCKNIKTESTLDAADNMFDMIKTISKTLGEVSKIIGYYAVGKVPLTDKDGNIIAMFKVDTKKAGINMSRVIGSFNWIITYTGIIGKHLIKTGALEAAEEMFGVIKEVCSSLTTVSKILGIFGTSKVPLTDKDGNVVAVMKINFDLAAKNMRSIVSTVLDTVTSMQSQYGNLLNETGCENAVLIFDTINEILSSFGNLGEILGALGTGKMIMKHGDSIILFKINTKLLRDTFKGVAEAVPAVIYELWATSPGFSTFANNKVTAQYCAAFENIGEVLDYIEDSMPAMQAVNKQLMKMVKTSNAKDIVLAGILIDAIFTFSMEMALLTALANTKTSSVLKEDRNKTQDLLYYFEDLAQMIVRSSNRIANTITTGLIMDVFKLKNIIHHFNSSFFSLEVFGWDTYLIGNNWNITNLGQRNARFNIKNDSARNNLLTNSVNLATSIITKSNEIQKLLKNAQIIDRYILRRLISTFNASLWDLEVFGWDTYVGSNGDWTIRTLGQRKNRFYLSYAKDYMNLAKKADDLSFTLISTSNYIAKDVKRSLLIDVKKMAYVISSLNLALFSLEVFGYQVYYTGKKWTTHNLKNRGELFKLNLIKTQIKLALDAQFLSKFLTYASYEMSRIIAKTTIIDAKKISYVVSRLNLTILALEMLGYQVYFANNRWTTSLKNKGNLFELKSLKRQIDLLGKSTYFVYDISYASTLMAAYVRKAQIIQYRKFNEIVASINAVIKGLELFGTESYTERTWYGYKQTKTRLMSVDLRKLDLLNNASKLILGILGINNKVSTSLEKGKFIDFDKFKLTVDLIMKSFSYLDNQQSVLQKIEQNIKAKILLSLYADSIKKLLFVQELASRIRIEDIYKAKKSLDLINESIESTPKNEYFDRNQVTLEKYVRTVNAINVSKVNSLTKLLNSMNLLAYRMGNIDNLTKTLANQMSNVLIRLTEEMSNAKQTIEKAQKLQKIRETSISKSIKEIRELMEIPMLVEITQYSGDGPDYSNYMSNTAYNSGGDEADPTKTPTEGEKPDGATTPTNTTAPTETKTQTNTQAPKTTQTTTKQGGTLTNTQTYVPAGGGGVTISESSVERMLHNIFQKGINISHNGTNYTFRPQK